MWYLHVHETKLHIPANEANCYIQLSCSFEAVRHQIHFISHQVRAQRLHWKTKIILCLPFSFSESIMKWLHVSNCYSKLSSLTSFSFCPRTILFYSAVFFASWIFCLFTGNRRGSLQHTVGTCADSLTWFSYAFWLNEKFMSFWQIVEVMGHWVE